jgi:hypothetical protein
VTAPPGYEGAPGGKLYEYLAACRPILAVPGSDDFVADILARTGHGVALRDADAVKEALEQLASGRMTAPAWPSSTIREFAWPVVSRKVADIFERCLDGRGTRALPSAEPSPGTTSLVKG